MADPAEAAKLLEQFKKQIEAGDFDGAKSTSTKLKLKCIEFTASTPALAKSPAAQKELMIVRDMLEQSIFFAVKLRDNTMFDRTFSQLKTFYTDLREHLPVSQHEYHILSLNLLRLLTQKRIAEFHVEIELLSEEAHANMYIQHATELEQQLMEGLYSKVLTSAASAPSPHSAWFMELLTTTVRDEIASCCAAAYERLLLVDAARMLKCSTQHDLVAYANQSGWRCDAQYVYFQDATKPAADAPNLDVFHHTLMYARELDRII